MSVYRYVHVFYEMRKGTMRGKNTLGIRRHKREANTIYSIWQANTREATGRRGEVSREQGNWEGE